MSTVEVRFYGDSKRVPLEDWLLGNLGDLCILCRMTYIHGFDVKVSSYDEERDPVGGLADELAASIAADRLRGELERLHDEEVFNRIINCAELATRVFRAAVRANVNPALAKISAPCADTRSISDLVHGGLTQLLDLVDVALLPIISGVAPIIRGEAVPNQVLKEKIELKSPTPIARSLEALGRVIKMSSSEYNMFTAIITYIAMKTLFTKFSIYFNTIRDTLHWILSSEYFQKAAEEARDPDVKRLAEIYAEIAKEILELAEYVEHLFSYLRIKASDMIIPSEYDRRRSDMLLSLEFGIRHALDVEEHIHHLIKEAEEVNERLKKKGLLLDMELESEEEIKRRLLEA